MRARLILVVIMSAFSWAGVMQSLTAQFAEIHSEHFLFGYPTGTPASNDLIIRDLYALSSNDQTKFADWVAYRLTPMEVMGSLDLFRNFRNDPFLEPDETLEANPASQDDYAGASALDYDRGHLAPLGSFKGSRQASQVNYYSNIVPQQAALNRGPWQRLESDVRTIVCTPAIVWVMTGSFYDGATPAPLLPNAINDPHIVPTGFWKIVATGDPLFVAAFSFDQNTPSGDDITDHLVSVEEIQMRSGLDFFRELTGPEQDMLEMNPKTQAEWDAVVIAGGCPQILP